MLTMSDYTYINEVLMFNFTYNKIIELSCFNADALSHHYLIDPAKPHIMQRMFLRRI
jgi:hypothetical protein